VHQTETEKTLRLPEKDGGRAAEGLLSLKERRRAVPLSTPHGRQG